MTDEPVAADLEDELEEAAPTPPAAADAALTPSPGVEAALESTVIATPRPADRPRQVLTTAALLLIAASVALMIISIVNQ